MNENDSRVIDSKNTLSPGNQLRKLRESRGLSLEQIAEQTHVRLQYLKALEKEDLEALYCPAYAKSYLKAYCRTIDADDTILDSYRDLIDASNMKTPTAVQKEPRSIPYRIPIVVILVLIGLLAVFFLKPRRNNESTNIRDIVISPDSLISAPDTTTIKSFEPVTLEDSLLTLRLIASETTWVRVMVDGSDKPGFIMTPGSIRIFDAREDFKLTLGNAGGVELNLNGQQLTPLGDAGQVVRDVPLDWKTIEVPRS